MATVKTQIVDVNGVVTHRNKRVEATQTSSGRVVSTVTPAALANATERPITDASDVASDIKSRYPGVVLHFSGSTNNGYATLDNITVPKDMRGQGIATKIMQELIDVADANGWNMALSPSADFGSSKARLVKFYGSFGFVPNSGRNKDYTTRETMLRMADE